MKTYWLLAGGALALSAYSLHAQESYPRLTGNVTIELENDYTFDSDDPTAEVNDLFTTTEAGLALEFSPTTALNATILLEPVEDATPNEDRIFEDHGIYAEELYLSHDFGFASALVGKFDPGFGFAWDVAPGIYGVDFAEDYELTERIGASVAIPIDLGLGEAELVVSAFMADRTFFSDSLLDSRGNVDRSDGGVSNTDAPESFVISLTGETNRFAYTVAARRQAKGAGDTDDEFGFVAGATTTLGGTDVKLLGEVAFFPHFDGGSDSAAYATIGAAAPVGPVTLSGVYTLREIENAPTDHLATVSAEYELAENAVIGVGYKFSRESGDDNHTIGALFVYEFGF